MKVQIKKLHPNTTIPKQSTLLAGGWDVTVTEIVQESKDFVICKLGFSLIPPDNYKITLVPRSSLTKTKWIVQNSPGLGDADFRGEYQFRFRAIPDYISENKQGFAEIFYEKFPYKEGDRIGQIYLEEVIPIEFEEVYELTTTNRGEGYGSSGL